MSASSPPSGGGGFPPELPSQVPDFVGEIHSAIAGALEAGANALGDVVSGIASAFTGTVAPAVPWEVIL